MCAGTLAGHPQHDRTHVEKLRVLMARADWPREGRHRAQEECHANAKYSATMVRRAVRKHCRPRKSVKHCRSVRHPRLTQLRPRRCYWRPRRPGPGPSWKRDQQSDNKTRWCCSAHTTLATSSGPSASTPPDGRKLTKSSCTSGLLRNVPAKSPMRRLPRCGSQAGSTSSTPAV